MNKNKRFDDRFKVKMGEISTRPLYGSWDTFRKKWMDAEWQENSISDDNFDNRLKSKLVSAKTALPSGHWQKLRYRLETIELFREKIILHKIKEVLAVVLFIFTFFNIARFPEITPDSTPVYALQNGTKNNAHVMSRDKTSVNNFHRAENVNNGSRINAHVQSPDLVSGHFSHSSGHTLNIAQLTSPVGSEIKPVTTGFSPIKSLNPSLVEQNNIGKTELLPVKNADVFSEVAAIMPMALVHKEMKHTSARLGIFVSKLHNFILTPFDKVYSVPEFSKSTNTFASGLTFGKKRGIFEMETGISYTRLNYQPVKIRETFASAADVYFETSLTRIQFDLVKIPLNLKYYMVDKNNWKFYALTGSALNVIASADYTIEENLVKGRPLSPYRFTSDGPRLEEKPFTKGFFADGHIRENYYVDFSMGIGLELKAGKNGYVYVQPSYHAFIFSDEIGVGPNQDKLNALQVQAGFKWTLHQ